MESQVSFNLIEMFVLQNLYLDGFLPELYVVTQCTIYRNLMKIDSWVGSQHQNSNQ